MKLFWIKVFLSQPIRHVGFIKERWNAEHMNLIFIITLTAAYDIVF